MTGHLPRKTGEGNELKERRHAHQPHPQPRHHHRRKGPLHLERDQGRRRAAGGRRHRGRRHLRRPASQAPDRPRHRHRQGDPAAGLRQRPSPCRPDAGAARLARHAARALVHHPHGDPQPRPLSRHALFGLRDDRLGHHHGAAHPGLDAGCALRRREARHRDHPRLRGCRHARQLLLRRARPEPPGLPGRRGVRGEPAEGAAGPHAALVRPLQDEPRRRDGHVQVASMRSITTSAG